MCCIFNSTSILVVHQTNQVVTKRGPRENMDIVTTKHFCYLFIYRYINSIYMPILQPILIHAVPLLWKIISGPIFDHPVAVSNHTWHIIGYSLILGTSDKCSVYCASYISKLYINLWNVRHLGFTWVSVLKLLQQDTLEPVSNAIVKIFFILRNRNAIHLSDYNYKCKLCHSGTLNMQFTFRTRTTQLILGLQYISIWNPGYR